VLKQNSTSKKVVLRYDFFIRLILKITVINVQKTYSVQRFKKPATNETRFWPNESQFTANKNGTSEEYLKCRLVTRQEL
jgi:hypothetical protein